jgi:hypothetical protein
MAKAKLAGETLGVRLASHFGVEDIRAATLAARKRLNDDRIGTCVEQGLFQVNRVEPRGRKVVVTPLSGFVPRAEAIAFLDGMAA